MNNTELAHRWAQRLGDSKKGSNFYYEGDTIFSYGEHCPAAKFYDNRSRTCVLMNSRGYSNTTAKHMSLVRNAVDLDRVTFMVSVPHVVINNYTEANQHRENMQYIIDVLDNTLKKCAKARQGLEYLIVTFDSLRDKAILYSSFFDVKKPCALPTITTEQRIAFDIRIKAAKEQTELTKQKAIARQMVDLNEWTLDFSKRGVFYNLPIKLRINAGKIETSRGASVPLHDGIAMANAFLNGKLTAGDTIGDYMVNEVSTSHVKIGCHTITSAEIERVFKGEQMKIKTIDIQAKEWFDKINGNSYFSAVITLNFGMKDATEHVLPFQYGYGAHFIHCAYEYLIKKGLIKNSLNSQTLSVYCRDNKIILRTSKKENCLKRELIKGE